MDTNVASNGEIVVVGAGLFGLTIALELRNRGHDSITVMDRYPPPVPDGSSVDISRVIRPDYADPFYAKMGIEAMEGWNSTYKSHFHRSGLLCMSQTKDHPYITGSKRNVKSLGLSLDDCDGQQAKNRYPGLHGDIAHMDGYLNQNSGWADAKGSIEHLAQQCRIAGVKFISGTEGTVTSLIVEGRNVIGVRTKSGSRIFASYFVLAVGSWTPHLVDMSQTSVSTGQPIGFLQLSHEEADELRSIPVVIDLSTGWFCFPPTPDTNILKMARHGYGYETTVCVRSEEVSAPSLENNNAAKSFIPEDAEKALRDGLNLFLPQFQGRDFIRRRLCWYQDTANGDFLVDHHPSFDNLFLACGGSGHAFKFLPILGRYLADAFIRQESTTQRQKWAWRQSSTPVLKGDGSRGGPPRRVLTTDEQARL